MVNLDTWLCVMDDYSSAVNERKSKVRACLSIRAVLHSEMLTVQKGSTRGKPRETDALPGVIYVGHIPHGFYEVEMRKFFSQFGRVTRVRLARSKKAIFYYYLSIIID